MSYILIGLLLAIGFALAPFIIYAVMAIVMLVLATLMVTAEYIVKFVKDILNNN